MDRENAGLNGVFAPGRCRWSGFLLVALLLNLSGPAAPAAPRYTSPALWQGEYFKPKEGGLYVKMILKKGLDNADEVKVVLYNPLTKSRYLFTHGVDEVEGSPAEIWKLPSGKYRVEKVWVVDDNGIRRTWTSRKRSIVIKRLSVSNLGLWTLVVRGKKKLAIKMKMVKNSYTEEQPKSKSSIRSVINGNNGLVQRIFAGKKLVKAARQNYSQGNEMRATFSQTRQISMVYSLNLFHHNRYAKSVMQVLEAEDPSLRSCYTEALNENHNLSGNVKFKFLLSKTTRSMKRLKKTGGRIQDPAMIRCLYYKLAPLTFPVTTNMIGEVDYKFEVRD